MVFKHNFKLTLFNGGSTKIVPSLSMTISFVKLRFNEISCVLMQNSKGKCSGSTQRYCLKSWGQKLEQLQLRVNTFHLITLPSYNNNNKAFQRRNFARPENAPIGSVWFGSGSSNRWRRESEMDYTSNFAIEMFIGTTCRCRTGGILRLVAHLQKFFEHAPYNNETLVTMNFKVRVLYSE